MAVRPPRQIALLPNAYTPELGENQRHFVAHPVLPGPQACLIEVRHRHKIEIVDALTIVPCDPRYSTDEVRDPLYACWLGVIIRFYKVDVSRLWKMWTFNPLAKTTQRQPPFLPVRHDHLVEFAQQFFDELIIGSGSKSAQVTPQTWVGFKESLAAAKIWYTRHIKMSEARKVCVEQWRILSLWESWEQPLTKKMSWADRWQDYLHWYPKQPTHASLPGRNKRASQELAAFKKRCGHIGLVRGTVPRERLNRRSLRRFSV
jgi:hypothetical protein